MGRRAAVAAGGARHSAGNRATNGLARTALSSALLAAANGRRRAAADLLFEVACGAREEVQS
jgi:hypothetical protein